MINDVARGTVIVAGASRGLGAAIAVAVANHFDTVVGLSRTGTSPSGIGLTCDVTDEESVRGVVREVGEAHGPITALVNNVGIVEWGASASFATERFDAVLRTNATAAFVLAREVHPWMVAAGGGSIINIGSMLDRVGAQKNVAYAASKAAIGAITRCLAVEWATDGIQVLNVAPGYISTEQAAAYLESSHGLDMLRTRNPLGRASTAEEVAAVVAGLLRDRVPYLTGETIYVDGGQSTRL